MATFASYWLLKTKELEQSWAVARAVARELRPAEATARAAAEDGAMEAGTA
ncbi:hypothetical protein [Alienimonas californiensis]|uniref:Uncharacterized protein n=1 Tax=Alienimonas californiensis TaxID=2527989 RepID=A0A517P6N6_9PLAN|nr:hypothetical protein [Alienimonas californiensis]QDT15037.1 hypothetical protein CA12_11170 [Alienimonas californiensis]